MGLYLAVLKIYRDLNKVVGHHFFLATFLSDLALRSLDSFLLNTKALYLSKSVSCSLLACWEYLFPRELSSKVFWTLSLAIAFLSLPEVTPLPTLSTCLVSCSLRMGMSCLLIPSPSINTLLSLTMSTMVASFPTWGPKLILATRPTCTNLLYP